MSALNVSSFIWGIADEVLRDVYVRGKYRDVILPMTVIRRHWRQVDHRRVRARPGPPGHGAETAAGRGGIEAFLRREVMPYAPDAWYVPDSVKVGYEISFTRHFYKPQPLRPLEEIRADIMKLERETEGLLAEIVSE